MKQSKNLIRRLLSFVAAAVMVVGLTAGTGVTALADSDYSITVKNTNSRVSIAGKEYSAYKIFDVTLGNATSTGEEPNQTTTYGAYAYTAKSDNWAVKMIINESDTTNVSKDSTTGVITNSKYGLTFTPTGTENSVTTYNVGTTSTNGFDDTKARTLADDLAAAVADQSNTTVVLPDTADGKATVATDAEQATINLTSGGYYAVFGSASSTDGNKSLVAAVALNTTDKTPTIEPKVDAPTLDKKITGIKGTADGAASSSNNIIDKGTDSTNTDTYNKGTIATAQVGDTVSFELKSVVPDLTGYSAYTYTITDTLSNGLTAPNADGITVKIGDISLTHYTNDSDAGAGKVKVTVSNQVITITIPMAALQKTSSNTDIAKDTAITVTYNATVNENALTTDYENNTATLKYSNNPTDNTSTETTPDKKTYVVDVDINVDKVDSANTTTKVPGAKFKLYRTGTNDSKEYYKYDSTNNKVTWITETDENKGDEFITGSDGSLYTVDSNDSKKASSTKATFKGLDAGTYYLVETEAPDGFNKLANPVKIKISAIMGLQSAKSTSQNVVIDYWVDDAQLPAVASNGTIALGTSNSNQPVVAPQIQNTSGVELPSTGGIGTTIFYVIGGVLVVGAVVILIARKRRNA